MNRRLQSPNRERLLHAIGDLAKGPRRGRACLVIDADRTLGPHDTGRLVGRSLGVDDAIRAVFEAHGYVEEAFSLVAEIWSGLEPEPYLAEVRKTVEVITIHAAWRTILDAARGRAPVVVVTAGIPQIWRLVLDRLGHTEVRVIGRCHGHLDVNVVCPETKAGLVGVLQDAGWTVIAAGDSPIDLPMLRRADVPLFVPDHKGSPALRAQLHLVPRTRHLLVDDRRFDGLMTCGAEDVIGMFHEGGARDAG
jgi:phosphoserine phosphatase